MLPLIGRIADLRGRLPVLTAALVVFAVGSLVTALAYDLPSMVAGRFLQGVGGGGLVPATLALVADLYPVERRGVPLGIVSAVQELGSVIGPLFGAVVLAVADWPAIFLINLAVGLVLAAAIRRLACHGEAARTRPTANRPQRGRAGLARCSSLLLVTLVFGAIVFIRPPEPGPRPDLGRVLHPVRRRRPLAHAGRPGADGRPGAVRGALRHREAAAGRPARLGPQRPGGRPHRSPVPRGRPGRRDPGLRHGRPAVQVFSDQGLWYLLGSAIATVAFVLHLRRAEAPLLPRGALRRTPAWGAVVVSFFVGAALIAALIDIPIFARTTDLPDGLRQLMAALVLVRFLVALPDRRDRRRLPDPHPQRRPGHRGRHGDVRGRLRADVAMGRRDRCTTRPRNIALVVCGFGFGLALAPVNAAILASTDPDVHGVSTAMVVVARMVGMLVGISALTTIGLHRYYAEAGRPRDA